MKHHAGILPVKEVKKGTSTVCAGTSGQWKAWPNSAARNGNAFQMRSTPLLMAFKTSTGSPVLNARRGFVSGMEFYHGDDCDMSSVQIRLIKCQRKVWGFDLREVQLLLRNIYERQEPSRHPTNLQSCHHLRMPSVARIEKSS